MSTWKLTWTKEIIKRVKIDNLRMRGVFAKHASHEELISKLYKEKNQ